MVVNDIPWDRIVHVYGRATQFPNYLTILENGSEKEQEFAIAEFQRTLEHQGTIFPATTVVLPFLFAYLEKSISPQFKFLCLFDDILDALLFQKEMRTIVYDKNLNFKMVLTDDYFWEEYTSEERDEFLWKEWEMNFDLIISITVNQFIKAKKLFLNISVLGKKKSKMKNLRNRILNKIDLLERSTTL